MGEVFPSISKIEHSLFHRNRFMSDGSNGYHRRDFLSPHPTQVKFFKVPHKQNTDLFHRNRIVSDGSNGYHRNYFLPRYPTQVNFLEVSHEQNVDFSIGIGSYPIDHLHQQAISIHLHFRFSNRGQGDTTGIWSTVLDNPVVD